MHHNLLFRLICNTKYGQILQHSRFTQIHAEHATCVNVSKNHRGSFDGRCQISASSLHVKRFSVELRHSGLSIWAILKYANLLLIIFV